MILNNRIKQARAYQDLTQAALAERVGVSRKTINTVENAVFIPSVMLALNIARELNTTVDALFFLKPEETGP